MTSTWSSPSLGVAAAVSASTARAAASASIGSDLPAMPRGPVRPVDLDNPAAGAAQVTGEPGAVGTGSLHTEGTDVAESGGPLVESLVADGRGRNLQVAESAAKGVERDGDVHVFVGRRARYNALNAPTDTSGEPHLYLTRAKAAQLGLGRPDHHRAVMARLVDLVS